MAPDDEQPATGGEEKSTRKASPVDQAVGNRVRMRRLILQMSQEILGERLGLTFQQVQKYEKGTNRISASRLWQLADVLGVTVDYFYEDVKQGVANAAAHPGMAERPSEPYLVEFLSTKEAMELNKAYSRITDPKQRRAILDFVRSMAPAETPEKK